VIPLTTAEKPPRRASFDEKVFIFIHLIFLVTGLAVFLLRPDDQQAWLLALLLGAFIGLSTWSMPVKELGRWVEYVVAFAKILCLWSLPLFVRFFLNFPERSPILRRWPMLEAYLNWPFYLLVLPYYGGGRLPSALRAWYFAHPPARWMRFGLSTLMLAAYLVAGLICLVVSYRVASRGALPDSVAGGWRGILPPGERHAGADQVAGNELPDHSATHPALVRLRDHPSQSDPDQPDHPSQRALRAGLARFGGAGDCGRVRGDVLCDGRRLQVCEPGERARGRHHFGRAGDHRLESGVLVSPARDRAAR